MKFLVNTHFHGDHTGGNALFHKDGATVVAQINVRQRLASRHHQRPDRRQDAAGRCRRAADQDLHRTATLKITGRHTVMLGHPHNAHTDGDTFVFFPDANVLSTGDIFTNGHYPNIDFANGGNIKGMIAGAQTYLKLANDKTKIVPGHGPLATKADLAAYLTMLTTARDRMAKLVKDGKSEADVVAAKPFADLDKTWAASDQASTNFIRVVYHSLADKPPGKTAAE